MRSIVPSITEVRALWSRNRPQVANASASHATTSSATSHQNPASTDNTMLAMAASNPVAVRTRSMRSRIRTRSA
jgi:hypothetical protein